VNERDEVQADAAQVLRSAFAGDGAGVVGAFESTVDRGGVDAACALAWGLAAAMVGDRLAAGPWRLEFPEIEHAAYDARWVARFISAYVNADEPTANALFRAAQVDGKLEACVLMLAGSAVATMKRRPVGRRTNDGPPPRR
jgi:hypothetical protein